MKKEDVHKSEKPTIEKIVEKEKIVYGGGGGRSSTKIDELEVLILVRKVH